MGALDLAVWWIVGIFVASVLWYCITTRPYPDDHLRESERLDHSDPTNSRAAQSLEGDARLGTNHPVERETA